MRHNHTAELNTTWTNDEVVEDSCHFQVVILPVSVVTASVATVICYHQLNGRTSTLIRTRAVFGCSHGVSGMLSV